MSKDKLIQYVLENRSNDMAAVRELQTRKGKFSYRGSSTDTVDDMKTAFKKGLNIE